MEAASATRAPIVEAVPPEDRRRSRAGADSDVPDPGAGAAEALMKCADLHILAPNFT